MKILLIRLFQIPIRVYSLILSPVLGARCRFHPNCSSYALEALEKHGILKGLFLSVRRVFRCHPRYKGSCHDSVPKSFAWPFLISYKRSIRSGGDTKKNV